MGRKRTILAWLMILGLSLLPYSANAQDRGSGPEERAIRHDLPTILAQDVHIDAVAVNADGDHALVQWHAGTTYRIGILVHYLNVWWLKHQILIHDDGAASCCYGMLGPGESSGATTRFLHELPDIPPDLADQAHQSIPLVAKADSIAPPPCAKGAFCPGKRSDFAFTVSLSFDSGCTGWVNNADAYDVTTCFAPNNAPPNAELMQPLAQPPTLAESWETPGQYGYFFFSATVDSASTIDVQSGTTFDAHFPFVLPTKNRYRLTITDLDATIGPVYGVLHNNALHFVLPAFTLTANTNISGKIEGQ